MTYRAGDQPIPGYILEALIGQGQLGHTWKATGPDGRPCALKVLQLSGVTSRDLRFPQALLNLNHPHVCPIFGAWILDADGQILSDSHLESFSFPGQMKPRMVLATGLGSKTLLQRLEECRSRGVPITELINYLDDAARGLDFLHQPEGSKPATVHGNVKPENLLLVGPSVQVCDYGLSRLDMTKGATKTFSIGSPFYQPPESLNDLSLPSSDQYSLAITYYHLRTGQLPFEESKALISHLTGVLDFTLLGDAEMKVLERATHKNPDQRFPSCTAFAAAMRAVVERTAEWQRVAGRSSSPPLVTTPPVLPPLPLPRPPSEPSPHEPPSSPMRSPGSFVEDPDDRNSTAATPPSTLNKAPTPSPAKSPTAVPATATFADDDLPLPSSGAWKSADKPRSTTGAGVSPHETESRSPRRSSVPSFDVEGQTTVRYYSVMNPDKLFPLLVTFTTQQLKELSQADVQQAASGPMKVDRNTELVVEPILPGCDVYPPVANLDIRSMNLPGNPDTDPQTRFYVVPRVLGRIDDARVVVRKNGQTITEIPLAIKVRRPRLAYVFSVLGLLSPLLMSRLKSLASDSEMQKNMSIPLYTDVARWLTQNIPPEYVLGLLLALAGIFFFLAIPRRRKSFWSLEKVS